MRNNKQIYEAPTIEYISLGIHSCVLSASTGTGNETFQDGDLNGAY